MDFTQSKRDGRKLSTGFEALALPAEAICPYTAADLEQALAGPEVE